METVHVRTIGPDSRVNWFPTASPVRKQNSTRSGHAESFTPKMANLREGFRRIIHYVSVPPTTSGRNSFRIREVTAARFRGRLARWHHRRIRRESARRATQQFRRGVQAWPTGVPCTSRGHRDGEGSSPSHQFRWVGLFQVSGLIDHEVAAQFCVGDRWIRPGRDDQSCQTRCDQENAHLTSPLCRVLQKYAHTPAATVLFITKKWIRRSVIWKRLIVTTITISTNGATDRFIAASRLSD